MANAFQRGAFQANAFQQGGAIAETDVAYRQARAGIMRAGASRANYLGTRAGEYGAYYYNVVVTINGVDTTAQILFPSLSITQNLNDEPDTARLRLRPPAPTLTPGHTITIGLGSASTNLEFAGQIVRVTHTFEKTVAGPLEFTDVEAIDWGRLIDRRLVLGEYNQRSATDIALDLLAQNTSGFTAHAIAPGLPTIDNFPLSNETVQGALKRLANLIDGGFYVDAYRDVHLFGSAGDTAPNAGTNPQPLAPSRWSLKAFSYTADVSQFRDRVIVEGRATRAAIGSPGSTTVALSAGVDFLIVAGGGHGGTVSGVAGGGGGGGVRDGSTMITSGAYPVVVGLGASSPGAGADSSVFGLSAKGGGTGAGDSASGGPGGSGGAGVGNRGTLQLGGPGVAGQGNTGGTGGYYWDDGPELFFDIGGGGGGAGSVGGNADVNTDYPNGKPGAGGNGRVSSITGTPTYYGGGGAGSSGTGQTKPGGLGGGGATGVAGTANTGGGGGANHAGGSGIVIIAYRTGDLTATGGTITTSGGRTIHTFTSNGTFTVSTVTVTVPPVAIQDFPLEDAAQIEDVAGTVRVANHALAYTSVLGPQLQPGQNAPASTLTADTGVGGTTLSVASGSGTFTEVPGWIKIDEQFVRYTAVGATSLTIPASGYGSLSAIVKSGTAVTWIGALRLATPFTFDPPFESGTDVVQRVTVDDTTGQGLVAALEGGDGIHEHYIEDERLSIDGAQGRGTSDLNTFSAPPGIVEAEWTTLDLNARPGRQQAVSFASLTATLLITSVEITFPKINYPPFRRCRASSLKQPGLYDVVLVQRT